MDDVSRETISAEQINKKNVSRETFRGGKTKNVSRETLRAEVANLFHVKHQVKVAFSKLPRIAADTESASLSIFGLQ